MGIKAGNVLLTILIIIVIVLALVLVFSNGSETQEVVKEQETIKIGFLGPLTKDLSALGQSSKKAVQLAIEEVNAKGGINEKQVEVIYEDSMCNGKDATSAGNKLINIDNVKYIVGGLCSSETLAVAPLAEEKQTIMISYCSSSPDVTDAGDFIFRNYPSDLFEGKYVADYAYNELGAKKVAIMSCQSDWCIGLKNVFNDRFKEIGGEIATIQEFEQGSSDLRTELTKVKETDPDIIYMVSYTESAVNGLKQAKELGIESSKFLGGSSWADPTIWEQTKDSSEGVIFASVESDAPESFVEKYRQRFGPKEDVTLCATQAYDGINLFAKVIEQVGDDSVAVKNELYNVKDYPGLSGTITFDENGDPTNAKIKLEMVKDGEPVRIN